VAAAASYFEVSADPQAAILVLQHSLQSRDLLTRDVAAYALAHSDPTNPALSKLLQPRKRKSPRRRSHTSLIVHGTWARASFWWQPPNGDFWKYLHDNVAPDLHSAADRFEWSGGYSDAARALAGNDLHDWVRQRNLDGLDLFTHSHGGSAAMLATHASTRVGRMVLLSCPVHWPKYTPDFSKVNKVVSIRVHLDLVILADRGGQKFDDPQISEHVLPVWFNHSATHDPAIWQKYNVPSML
jgi:pimeloyl-ACP methyl ester carboxylesterase